MGTLTEGRFAYIWLRPGYVSQPHMSFSLPLSKQHFSLIQQNILNTRNVPGTMVTCDIITPNPKHNCARQVVSHVTVEGLCI